MSRLRRGTFLRKQSIYRAIESDNARKAEAESAKPVIPQEPEPAPSPRVDNRDPVEIARAARSALRGEQ